MATVICEICGDLLDDPAAASCDGCGAPIARRQTAAHRAATASAKGSSAAGSTVGPRPDDVPPNAPPAGCDHRGMPPGAVICTDCHQPAVAVGHAGAAGPRRAVLSFPWGEAALGAGEVLEIGREVGPLQHQLEPYGTVGRRHATLRLTAEGVLLVRDHSSMNGTFVDAARCSPAADFDVPAGTELRFSRSLRVMVRFE